MAEPELWLLWKVLVATVLFAVPLVIVMQKFGYGTLLVLGLIAVMELPLVHQYGVLTWFVLVVVCGVVIFMCTFSLVAENGFMVRYSEVLLGTTATLALLGYSAMLVWHGSGNLTVLRADVPFLASHIALCSLGISFLATWQLVRVQKEEV